MSQNQVESEAFLHGAGEREIDRVSRQIRGQRLRRQGNVPLQWLAYRRLDSMRRQAMIGVQAVPLAHGSGIQASGATGRRRARREEGTAEKSLLVDALRQAASWSVPLRLMMPQDELTVPDRFFLERLERALDETGFPPWRLDVSFPQAVLCEGGAQYWMTLAALRDGGVRIFMRDFLTPPSSLSFLEEACRAAVLDGVQFKAAALLAEEEGSIFDSEVPFRQHLLRAVRALGLTAQICGVAAAQEECIGRYMRMDGASISETVDEVWGSCEVMAPLSEALSHMAFQEGMVA